MQVCHMARHAQPREAAELKGALKKDPQRYRGKTVKSEQPLGIAPDHLTKAQKAAWFELESHALPGVLTGADRFMLEAAAILLVKFRRDMGNFPAAKLNAYIGILARLGLSPADRQKFTAPDKPSENPYLNLEQ